VIEPRVTERLETDDPAGHLGLRAALRPGQDRLVENLAARRRVQSIGLDQEIEHLVVDHSRQALQIPRAIAAILFDPLRREIAERARLTLP